VYPCPRHGGSIRGRLHIDPSSPRCDGRLPVIKEGLIGEEALQPLPSFRIRDQGRVAIPNGRFSVAGERNVDGNHFRVDGNDGTGCALEV
jgi:hypothetical protein